MTDPEAIAKKIEIQVRQTKLPASALESLISEFSKTSFQPALSMSRATRLMGGVQYDLWLDASDGSSIHYSFKDGYEESERVALASWMNRVRRVALEHVAVSAKGDK